MMSHLHMSIILCRWPRQSSLINLEAARMLQNHNRKGASGGSSPSPSRLLWPAMRNGAVSDTIKAPFLNHTGRLQHYLKVLSHMIWGWHHGRKCSSATDGTAWVIRGGISLSFSEIRVLYLCKWCGNSMKHSNDDKMLHCEAFIS